MTAPVPATSNISLVLGDADGTVVTADDSGLGIAMENAGPDVQAGVVTASYEEEGFAKAIAKCIQPRAPAALSEAR
jgi:hydroxymethylpyrimidine pyrophosphatase-like HAD family hydrolase